MLQIEGRSGRNAGTQIEGVCPGTYHGHLKQILHQVLSEDLIRKEMGEICFVIHCF
jgi:hypothetical protein